MPMTESWAHFRRATMGLRAQGLPYALHIFERTWYAPERSRTFTSPGQGNAGGAVAPTFFCYHGKSRNTWNSSASPSPKKWSAPSMTRTSGRRLPGERLAFRHQRLQARQRTEFVPVPHDDEPESRHPGEKAQVHEGDGGRDEDGAVGGSTPGAGPGPPPRPRRSSPPRSEAREYGTSGTPGPRPRLRLPPRRRHKPRCSAPPPGS